MVTWKPHPVYKKYLVSDTGLVRGPSGRVLKPWKCPQGRYYVVVCDPSLPRGELTYAVHRMVLETWVGFRPEGMEACHGANGADDNSKWNLSWGTHSKNNGPDKVRDGKSNRGERCGTSKLKFEEVIEILDLLLNTDLLLREIADRFGVTLEAIGSIKRGRRWQHDVKKYYKKQGVDAKQIYNDIKAKRVNWRNKKLACCQ